jgi:hypothetical protein
MTAAALNTAHLSHLGNLPKGVTVDVEWIGPAQATEFLKSNTNNRNQKEHSILDYANDMRTGNWAFNGASICFDVNGTLLDGQNRLTAVVRSSTKQLFLVVRGLQPRTMTTIDTGSKRSPADAFKIAGLAEGSFNQLAAITKGLLLLKNGGRPSISDQTAFMEKNRKQVVSAYRISVNAGAALKARKLLGVAAFYTNREDVFKSAQFFDALATGAELSYGDPRLTLRNKLQQDITIGRCNTSISDLTLHVATVLHAWNAFKNDEQVRVIRQWKGVNSAAQILPSDAVAALSSPGRA